MATLGQQQQQPTNYFGTVPQTPYNINYYTTPGKMYQEPYPYRDMDRMNGYMYYPGGNGSNGSGGSGNSAGSNSGGSISYYTEMPYIGQRDPREGRAAIRRRMYMEGKETHNDKNFQLKELEAYLQELSSDLT